MIVLFVFDFILVWGCVFLEEESVFWFCFQRDCDWIIYFSVFCCLKYKMQVFVEYEGDYYCMWLIYLIEVVQVVWMIVGVLGLN